MSLEVPIRITARRCPRPIGRPPPTRIRLLSVHISWYTSGREGPDLHPVSIPQKREHAPALAVERLAVRRCAAGGGGGLEDLAAGRGGTVGVSWFAGEDWSGKNEEGAQGGTRQVELWRWVRTDRLGW